MNSIKTKIKLIKFCKMDYHNIDIIVRKITAKNNINKEELESHTWIMVAISVKNGLIKLKERNMMSKENDKIKLFDFCNKDIIELNKLILDFKLKHKISDVEHEDLTYITISEYIKKGLVSI